jgi:hypothetical protein
MRNICRSECKKLTIRNTSPATVASPSPRPHRIEGQHGNSRTEKRQGERERERAASRRRLVALEAPMADSEDAPPAVHRRPPRPARGAAAAQGFAAALRRRLRSGAAVAARASFAADSGDESGPGEPSSSRRRDNSGGASSAAGGRAGAGDFSAFTFRAAAPVHRKAKESPLSSDAIFKQVRAGTYLIAAPARPVRRDVSYSAADFNFSAMLVWFHQ